MLPSLDVIALSLRDIDTFEDLYTVDDIITNSQSIKILKERIKMVADTDSSVLIYGETGMGEDTGGPVHPQQQ